MPREHLPITPAVLRWARERARFAIDEMRPRFRGIEEWERGEASPTYPQLERLSDAYKVPVAVFFFPDPPEVPPIQESFRTLPDVQFDALPRRVRSLLRKARVFQINLSELNDGRNPAERLILHELRFVHDMDVPSMARHVRRYLGVSLEDQVGWKDIDDAFDVWRSVLEKHGVAVFKDAFQSDFCSGFCLYDDVFPLIYVNNSAKSRQIFTLFHELAHLLFQTSGIDALVDESGRGLPPHLKQIEVVCNSFAAEFLLPSVRFESDIVGMSPSEQTASILADRYHISREFIFRRFLDRGDISEGEYLSAAQRWAEQRGDGEGGNYYWTKIAYLGTGYLGLAFSRFRQNRITEPELADYLDTKVRNLSKLEDYLARKST